MAISYSGYSTYVECPSKFQRSYLLKESKKQPTREDAPAMFRGTDLHNAVEDLLNDKRNDLPKDIAHYAQFAVGLRTQGAKAEVSFAFNDKWGEVDFDSEDAEIRGFLDCKLHTEQQLIIYEWKTGKRYDSHVTQRNLYGLAGLLLHPEHQKVRVITTYFDQGVNEETTYHIEMLSTYKWMWTRHINSTKPPQPYPMRPSWKCKFCGFSKYNGGKCPN